MTKKSRIKHILGALMLSVLMGISALYPAYSLGYEDTYPSISPVSEHIELNPGDTFSDVFKVGNNGGKEFSYKIYADPYQTSDEYGNISYSERNSYTQIVDWIKFDKTSGSVKPGAHDVITYTVNVPNDAPAGGQYAALVVEADSGDKTDNNGVQVNTVTRVAYILYAKVAGETNECAKILSDSINTFMFEPPITSSSLVEACGNVDVKASYSLKVTPLFSDKEIYDTSEEPMEKYILPGTRRFNTISWSKEDGAPTIGIYNVEQTVKIGKETSTIKKLVFIFPLWLIIIFILLIGAIIFWLVSRSRKRKETKRSSVNTRVDE